MFDKFITELENLLSEKDGHNIDVAAVLKEYSEKYASLIEEGKSEEEILAIFGRPEDIATALIKEKKREKPTTKSSIILTDCFFFAPAAIVAVCGIIAIAFIGILTGIIGCSYLYYSWVDFTGNTRIYAFIMAILCVVMCVASLFLTYKTIKICVKGSKKYFDDRKEKMQNVK